jgi:hypothetical protein
MGIAFYVFCVFLLEHHVNILREVGSKRDPNLSTTDDATTQRTPKTVGGRFDCLSKGQDRPVLSLARQRVWWNDDGNTRATTRVPSSSQTPRSGSLRYREKDWIGLRAQQQLLAGLCRPERNRTSTTSTTGTPNTASISHTTEPPTRTHRAPNVDTVAPLNEGHVARDITSEEHGREDGGGSLFMSVMVIDRFAEGNWAERWAAMECDG